MYRLISLQPHQIRFTPLSHVPITETVLRVQFSNTTAAEERTIDISSASLSFTLRTEGCYHCHMLLISMCLAIESQIITKIRRQLNLFARLECRHAQIRTTATSKGISKVATTAATHRILASHCSEINLC